MQSSNGELRHDRNQTLLRRGRRRRHPRRRPPADARSLRFAAEAPPTDSQALAAEKMSELLSERTGGELDLKVFAGSTLGNHQAAITGTRGSTIDMFVTGSGNLGGLVPEIGMVDIPFIFQDSDHAYRVLDGEVGRELLDQLDDGRPQGPRVLGERLAARSPPRRRRSTYRTTCRSQDPHHRRARAHPGLRAPRLQPGADADRRALHRARDGTVEAQEHPLGVFMSSKFYEVQDNITLSYHAYSPLVVAMNLAKFNELSPEFQEALLSSALDAATFQREMNADRLIEQVAELKAWARTSSRRSIRPRSWR